jgi:hypothetical protein
MANEEKKSIYENILYYLKPSSVEKIEKPLTDKNKYKNSTEFGNLAADIPDVDVVSASSYNSIFQMDTSNSNNINDTIKRYRNIAEIGYVDQAISEIVNQAIFRDTITQELIKLNFNDKHNKISEKLRGKIIEEFDNILDILDFDDQGDAFFKQWYIDGRLLLQVIFDENNIKAGIKKVKLMSPLNVKRHLDVKEKKTFWVYEDDPDQRTSANAGVNGVGENQNDMKYATTIPDELVIFVPSGKYSLDGRVPLSYLHIALRDISRLDTLEDHFLIYRIVRSPERRVFYIDPGNIPPKKAESYLKQIMNTYKQNKVFNDKEGTIESKNQHPSMLEDFFLLRRNGKGTEIDTVGSAGGLGEIEDLFYFQKKALASMRVPFSRLNSDDRQTTSVISQTANEITREELKFSKFIDELRRKFNTLFFQLLKRQLIYKNIISLKDWDSIKRKLTFVYPSDTKFAQAKRLSNLSQQMEVLRDIKEYQGSYYTHDDIFKEVRGFTDDDIKNHLIKIQEEKIKYKILDDVEDEGGGF